MEPFKQRIRSMPRGRRKLRNLGIYRLPDGRQFVVSALFTNRYSLYSLKSWGIIRWAEYQVDEEGRFLSKGIKTRWRIQDLADTGQTAMYWKVSRLL